MKTCGVILAGGKSTRMGTNKALLDLNNRPVIEHITSEFNKCTDKLALITNSPGTYQYLGIDSYIDRYRDKGPLAGLESALYYVHADLYMIAACDMPFITKDIYLYLLEALGQKDAAIPIYQDKIHPLAGIYRKNALPHIQMLLDNDNRKIRELFKFINVCYVNDFKGFSEQDLTKHFLNMNNPSDYEMAKRLTF